VRGLDCNALAYSTLSTGFVHSRGLCGIEGGNIISFLQPGLLISTCKGENKIVELPEHYVHSSAKFYITGEQGVYPVTSYTELDDIDLTK
jgi:hypothetical protein